MRKTTRKTGRGHRFPVLVILFFSFTEYSNATTPSDCPVSVICSSVDDLAIQLWICAPILLTAPFYDLLSELWYSMTTGPIQDFYYILVS
jgi:hypothetical protein